MILFYKAIRIILYPLIRYMLPLFSSKVANRVEFEHKNFLRTPAIEKASFGFEVSSEGELEQVYPLVERLLENEERVELIYASDSVDKKIMEMIKRFPQQIRAHILPLICYQPLSSEHNIGKWLTTKKLFMCRYDFFPELMHYGKKRTENFILLSASLKGFENKSSFTKWYYRKCYQSFHKIVAVSEIEKERMVQFFDISHEKIEVFDFRVTQIEKRIQSTESTLNEKWPLWKKFKGLIDSNAKPNLMLGSYWEDDREILKLSQNKLNITVVPHKLGGEDLEKLRAYLEQESIDFMQIDEDTKEIPNDFQGVFILNLKGILCELYTFFEFAYVGGGFGVSIHSVLEPYIAGCRVLTGPNNNRSSEFDMIAAFDPAQISAYQNHSDIVSAVVEKPRLPSQYKRFVDENRVQFPMILDWLGLSQGDQNA